jgi:hypothetical protein
MTIRDRWGRVGVDCIRASAPALNLSMREGDLMKKSLAGAAVGIVAVAVFAVWSNMIDIHFPWEALPDLAAVEVELSLPDEARIVAVEPIALDCRARVHAEVPVEGTREHRLLGQVYRTDTVTLDAIGDVDTCVEGTSADVVYHRDGSTEVIIPGESIVFVRPRVDAVATADSVHVAKGTMGKITDVFPWVEDDLGLTPLAYAYAQNVIGSSQCMEAAYSVTRQVLIDAYRQQFIDQGADPDSLEVRIDGRPNFGSPPPLDMGPDVTMSVGADDIVCTTADGLGRLIPQQ